MRSLQFVRYGAPSEHTLTFKEKPAPSKDDLKPTEVFVHTKAVAVNPVDWKILSGKFRQIMPHKPGDTVAYDGAGIIEAVGSSVTLYKPGDEIFFRPSDWTASQEYVIIDQELTALRPSNATIEEAPALSIAGTTAYQCVFEVGKVTSENTKVALVTAGLGGVGYFAVQYLKNVANVERVIATVSTAKLDLAKQLLPGVELIDYKKEDFGQKLNGQVDFVCDTTGEYAKIAQAIKPHGIIASVGGIPSVEYFSNAPFYIRFALRLKNCWDSSYFRAKRASFTAFMLRANHADFDKVARLVESGKVHILIDHIYDWEDAIKAWQELYKGSATGKIIYRV